MSAVASFTRIPRNMVEGLREAAVPKRGLFGGVRDTYDDYLEKHGRNAAEFEWSGYVLATLLPYLQEREQIDLMNSEYRDLAAFLSKARRTTHFIFTEAQRKAYLEKLDAPFSEEALRDYYNEFNEAQEAEAGRPMLDGIRALHQCLSGLDDESVIVLCIG